MPRRVDAYLALAKRPLDRLLDRLPDFLRPFLDYRGRSQRSDFITYLFASLLVALATYLIGSSPEARIVTPEGTTILSGAGTPLEWLVALAQWFMSVWLTVFLCRRLHDQDLSSIYLLILLVTGSLLGLANFGNSLLVVYFTISVLIIFAVIFVRGTIGPNRFGPDPRGWKSEKHYEQELARLQSAP